MTAPDLSVIVPSYNERENLPELIRRLHAVLVGIDFEVIVVDDDSPDGTWRVVEAIAAADPRVRLYHRIGRKGLSSAVVDGCAMAKGRLLAVMDADLQHDEAVLPRMAALLDRQEVVVATRHAEGGSTGSFAWHRRLMSAAATAAVRLLLGVRVSDPMSGFFALRREVFDRVSSQLQPRGFKILLELLWRARIRQVGEVGYTFRDRIAGESKLDSSVIIDFLVALVSMRLGSLLTPRFVRYGAVGLSGVAVQLGTTAGFRTWEDSPALAIGIAVAMVWNFVLNNLWTFRDARGGGPLVTLRRLLQFTLVCGAGAVINHAVALDALRYIDSRPVAGLAGIAFATCWNYTLNRLWTWDADA